MSAWHSADDVSSTGLSPDDESAIVAPDMMFIASQLHDRSAHGWAVVGHPSGAIATRSGGALLMRLRQDEAERLASSMTEQALRPITQH